MSNPLRIEGYHYRSKQPIAIKIDNGTIVEIDLLKDNEADLCWIAPGLVDLQINGFMGHDFNRLPFTAGLIRKVTTELWKEGVTSYFPAIITNSSEKIKQAVMEISNTRRHDIDVEQCVTGIHLEGPFISAEDGPRGAHDKAYIIPPDWELFLQWQEAANGLIRIITLSPEWENAPEFISRCVASGVMVSIGHTKANTEQIRRAVDAGARMSTHLGNGTHPILARHPNYIWDQLAEDRLFICLIADGFHLPESFLKVAMRVKGDNVLLVSDSVALSGMPPGEYDEPIGSRVVKTIEGKLHLAGNSHLLAGSAQALLWNIEHLVRSGLCTMEDAWEMASIRPASFIGLPAEAGITVGSPADLVVFRKEADRFRIVQTYKNGVGRLAT
jgi:N-acetylglucosamine-6-phosphate deacetylase